MSHHKIAICFRQELSDDRYIIVRINRYILISFTYGISALDLKLSIDVLLIPNRYPPFFAG